MAGRGTRRLIDRRLARLGAFISVLLSVPACTPEYLGCAEADFDAVAADQAGGLYVAGRLSGRTSFLGQELDANHVRSPYVARLSATGKRVWLKLLPTGEGVETNPPPIDVAGAADGVVVFGGGAAATRYDGKGNVAATVGIINGLSTPSPLVGALPASTGAVTSDGAMVVELDNRLYLGRFDATGAALWATSRGPKPLGRMIPDLTGGVWVLNDDGTATRLDATGAQVAVAASGISPNAFSTGVATRDAAGDEIVIMANATWGSWAFDGVGTPLWSHPGDTADVVVSDGAGGIIRVSWNGGDSSTLVTWSDTSGTVVASVSSRVDATGRTVHLTAAGTATGAFISGQLDAMSDMGCTPPHHFLLKASTADHSLTSWPTHD